MANGYAVWIDITGNLADEEAAAGLAAAIAADAPTLTWGGGVLDTPEAAMSEIRRAVAAGLPLRMEENDRGEDDLPLTTQFCADNELGYAIGAECNDGYGGTEATVVYAAPGLPDGGFVMHGLDEANPVVLVSEVVRLVRAGDAGALNAVLAARANPRSFMAASLSAGFDIAAVPATGRR